MVSKRWFIPTLLGAAVVFAMILGALGITHYVWAVNTWSDDSAFASDVADAVADSVAEAVGAALDNVGQTLAEVEFAGKRLTVAEFTHLRELQVAGKTEEVRRELESRFSQAELRELHRRLAALASNQKP